MAFSIKVLAGKGYQVTMLLLLLGHFVGKNIREFRGIFSNLSPFPNFFLLENIGLRESRMRLSDRSAAVGYLSMCCDGSNLVMKPGFLAVAQMSHSNLSILFSHGDFFSPKVTSLQQTVQLTRKRYSFLSSAAETDFLVQDRGGIQLKGNPSGLP
jgi:hypothetical protein